MSTRHRTQLFRDFERWAFDEMGYSPRTRETYYHAARAANRWLEDNRGVSICWARPKDLQAFLFSRSTNARTRNGIRQALISFGDFLIDREYCEVNPAKALPRLPVPRLLPKALDGEYAKRALTAARTIDLRTEAAVSLLLYTGIRRAELLELEWPNFEPDLRAPKVWLRYTAKGRGGKSKARSLPLHDIAGGGLVKILNRWRTECEDARWVFPSASPRKTGHHISRGALANWLNEVGDATGIHLYPHLLRHTCATLLLDSGVDVRVVQEWLGHESLATTQVYTKVHSKSLEEAARKMNLEKMKSDEVEAG